MFDLCVNETRPDAILFENADWRVLDEGLEHRDTGYFIDRTMLAMRRGDLWEWPLHLAEKSWCTPRLFREAFLAALETFGLGRDPMLTRTFATAFGLTTGPGRVGERDEFVALGDVVRPKSASGAKPGRAGATARKRVPEARPSIRRSGQSAPARVGDTAPQHATLRV